MDNYNNINYQSTESFSSSPIENNTENNIFIINWIFQILLWIDLLLIIIININVPIIIFIFLYLIYLIIEFNSPLKGQLYSLYEKSFYEELKKIISSSPNIKFNIETFHFKNRIHPTIKLSKNTISPTIITRVISYKNSIDFPYYSFKDVSGVLYLEDEINKSNEYSFIKLKIKQEINFADEISYNDYITFRNNLILKNKNIDSFVNITWAPPLCPQGHDGQRPACGRQLRHGRCSSAGRSLVHAFGGGQANGSHTQEQLWHPADECAGSRASHRPRRNSFL